MPIAKFLDIEVPNSKVRLDIPVNKYKFNCDIKSKEVIEEFNNDEEYDNSDKVDDGDARPFAGRVRQGIGRHGAADRAEGNRCFGSRHRICTET